MWPRALVNNQINWCYGRPNSSRSGQIYNNIEIIRIVLLLICINGRESFPPHFSETRPRLVNRSLVHGGILDVTLPSTRNLVDLKVIDSSFGQGHEFYIQRSAGELGNMDLYTIRQTAHVPTLELGMCLTFKAFVPAHQIQVHCHDWYSLLSCLD